MGDVRVGELQQRTGVSLRALRYYEKIGVLVPQRSSNGYRSYPPVAVEQVKQIQQLAALGFSVAQTKPFLDCIASGHSLSDDCPASLAAYRTAISLLDGRIEELKAWRQTLTTRLGSAAERAVTPAVPAWAPEGEGSLVACPAPELAPDRLIGHPLPPLHLASTDGSTVRLDSLGTGRSVLYIYPLTGRPGIDLPDGWEGIPGAQGCTAEACGFRDHHDELRDAGAARVYGLSSQPSAYQRELAERLALPFAVLSDPELELSKEIGLPTFHAGPHRLFARITMVVRDGLVEHVWWPIADPAAHPADVLAWLGRRA